MEVVAKDAPPSPPQSTLAQTLTRVVGSRSEDDSALLVGATLVLPLLVFSVWCGQRRRRKVALAAGDSQRHQAVEKEVESPVRVDVQ